MVKDLRRCALSALLSAFCAFAAEGNGGAPGAAPVPDDFFRAETPWSARRAAGLGAFGFASASDWIERPAGALLPWSATLDFAPLGPVPSLLGERRELFAPGPRDSLSGVLVGNEVGDQLWQEVASPARIENRTPTTQAFGAIPFGNALLWGDLRQVDHWSAKYAQARKARVVEANRWGETYEDLHSWFGENYPDFSYFGGGLRWEGPQLRAGVQGRSAWWWPLSPGTRREIPLLVDALSGSAEFAGWSADARYFRGEIFALDTAIDGENFEIAEFAVARSLGPVHPWIRFRDTRASEEFPLRPADENVLLAGLDHEIGLLPGFVFSGSHWVGNGFWGASDTLAFAQRIGGHRLSEALFLRLSNVRSPLERWREFAPGDRSDTLADLAHVSTWQHYGLRLAWDSAPLGPFRVSLSATPWTGVDLPAFRSESWTWSERRWIRTGREATAEGAVWGMQDRLVVDFSRCPCRLWQFEALREDALAGPWGKMELVPAEWRLALRHSWKFPSDLEIRAALLWTSGATIRQRSPEAWSEGDRAELNAELRQSFFDGRVRFWLSLLNPISDDEPLVPDGPEDRFRAVAGFAVKI